MYNPVEFVPHSIQYKNSNQIKVQVEEKRILLPRFSRLRG